MSEGLISYTLVAINKIVRIKATIFLIIQELVTTIPRTQLIRQKLKKQSQIKSTQKNQTFPG